ncbi:DUF7927 domain-containing protein [Tessaracoccus caeni]|uniref:DUF7927 domain-containing protein n=1 Tax=Tessaracoccus caeni TaxID=3031239 RepID=UPI0023DB1BC9|nr:SpaA isopeptide-forming pilin-related protein [Tessaracoccus caeni]MDF1488898.1 SpaA isopeptide-forming pilin-related protein [Tessaracoccus caeni]
MGAPTLLNTATLPSSMYAVADEGTEGTSLPDASSELSNDPSDPTVQAPPAEDETPVVDQEPPAEELPSPDEESTPLSPEDEEEEADPAETGEDQPDDEPTDQEKPDDKPAGKKKSSDEPSNEEQPADAPADDPGIIFSPLGSGIPPHLAIAKQATASAPTALGSTVSYQITATNTGIVDYTVGNPARIEDDLSDVMSAAGATFTGTATAKVDGSPVTAPTWSAGNTRLSWSGPLAVGKTVTITYDIHLDRLTDQPRVLSNVAWSPADPADLTPPASCEVPTGGGSQAVTPDGEPCGATTTTIDPPPPLFLGSCTVTTFEEDNAGWMVRSTEFGIDDTIARHPAVRVPTGGRPGGALHTHDLDTNWTEFVSPDLQAGGYVTDYRNLVGHSFSYDFYYIPEKNGFLYPMYIALESTDGERIWFLTTNQVRDVGEWYRVTIPLSRSRWLTGPFTYDDGPSGSAPPAAMFQRILGSLKQIYIGAEGASGDDDSWLDNFGSPCDPDLEITKSTTATELTLPGETVSYTVNLTNTGDAHYTSSNPVHLFDDLTDVVDDASFTGVATAKVDGVNVTAPVWDPVSKRLTWTGPLAMGKTVTITYDVVVERTVSNRKLHNIAWSPADPAEAPTPESCSATGAPCGETTTQMPPLPMICSAEERRGTERYWFFGNKAGIDFGATGTAPGAAFLGTQDTSEGSTVVTDEQGNLQFWSNGQSVFDRNGGVMSNGTGLLGNSSAVQTVASFPAAGQPGKFFLITTTTDVNNSTTRQLHYHTVDMTLNGGLGAVTAKNVLLGQANTASEAITAVPNATGDGYWVLTSTNSTPNILAYQFNANGPVTGQAVISVMPSDNGNRYATLSFNADYTQLVQLTAQGTNGTGTWSKLRLLDFNAATGEVEQRLEWGMPMKPAAPNSGRHGYAADFSPSGDYVYATKVFETSRLYRYRIAGATTGEEVKDTELYLGSMGSQGGQVRRAPDGRMYVANTNGTALSIVTNPDATTPTYTQNGFPLPAGSTSQGGLPQMVTGCPPVTRSSSVTKTTTASAASRLGDTVSYTVSLHNTGAGAYNSAAPAHVVDDLSEVLDESTWVGASAKLASAPAGPDVGTLTFNPVTKLLRWSGPLAVDATVDITYTITIGDDLDGKLRNIAWIPDDPANPIKPATCTEEDDSCAETVTMMPTLPLVCPVEDRRGTERFWFFGTQAGIDFGASGTTSQPFRTTQTTTEGSTVVTDEQGNLQFWSNGQSVFDRNSNVMVNGTDLTGNASATQTVASFPVAGQPGKFFVVTTNTDVNQTAKNGQLRYSVVDMTQNNGLGAVTSTKNVNLGASNTASEAITAAPNATGDGYWVLTYTNNSPNILAYEFDADGPVTGIPVVSTMSNNNGNRYGTLAFNADYTQLVQLTTTGPLATAGSSKVRMLNFNAATGKIRQRYEWQLLEGADTGRHGYNAEFSPAGDYVYTTKIFDTGRLYRYRVAGATTGSEVKGTEELLGELAGDGGQVRRAPDGRMYVATWAGSALNVVTNPDAATPAFTQSGFALAAGSRSRYGLPQMVTGCPPVTRSSAVTKQTTATADSRPGDTVSYTVSLENTGAGAYTLFTPAHVVDDLSDVLDEANWVGVTAKLAGAPGGPEVGTTTFDPATKMLRWSGPLAAGATVEITYTVTIGKVTNGELRNMAWIPENPMSPEKPTTCAVDDDSCAETLTLLPRLEVTKTADETELPMLGQQVTYTVTLINRGPGVYTDDAPATMLDDMSAVLDKATLNSINGNFGFAEFDPVAKTLSWRGELAVDDPVILTYTVTYTGANDDGEYTLFNEVCVDERNAIPGHPACAPVSVPAAGLEYWKTVSSSSNSVIAGTVLSYQLHFRNSGDIPATVDMVDHLADVLDDADVVLEPGSPPGLATLAAARTGNQIALTGTVPADGTIYTIEYHVEVRPNGQRGNSVADNFLLNDGDLPPTDGCQPNPRYQTCTSTDIAGAVRVWKMVDGPSGPQPIYGADFEVLADDGGQPAATPLADPALTPGDMAGMVELTGIPVGHYWLRETRAPEGYSLLAEEVPFEIAADGSVVVHGDHPQVTVSEDNGTWTIRVIDLKAFELPLAGGPGDLLWTVGGLVLMVSAGVLIMRRRRLLSTGGPESHL